MSFSFNATPTTWIYTLSLHDALPILNAARAPSRPRHPPECPARRRDPLPVGSTSAPSCRRMAASLVSRTEGGTVGRSEEHTSELQSQSNLVCRLLLEKKKDNMYCRAN